jgi:hypothetical protein
LQGAAYRPRPERPGVICRGDSIRSIRSPASGSYAIAAVASFAASPAGRPTEQSALAQTVARLEWAALAAEAEGGLKALREAREHRRLLQKLLVDFERTVRAVAAPSAPSLAEYLATKAAEGAAA